MPQNSSQPAYTQKNNTHRAKRSFVVVVVGVRWLIYGPSTVHGSEIGAENHDDTTGATTRTMTLRWAAMFGRCFGWLTAGFYADVTRCADRVSHNRSMQHTSSDDDVEDDMTAIGFTTRCVPGQPPFLSRSAHSSSRCIWRSARSI